MAKNKTVANILYTIGFLIVVAIIFITSCTVFKAQCGIDILSKFSKSKPQPTVAVIVAPTDTVQLITASFKGILPCADCPGLDTDLILKKQKVDSLNGTYVMKEVYLERNVNPIITEGTWKTIFSSSKGKPETIFELNSGKPDSLQYFLDIGESGLKMLDKDKNEIIAAGQNFILKKL